MLHICEQERIFLSICPINSLILQILNILRIKKHLHEENVYATQVRKANDMRKNLENNNF